MPLRRFRRSPGRAKAVALAVALHVVVIGLLVIGFNWPALTGRDTEIVQAVVVDADKLNRDEAKKKAEAEQRKREEEARRQAAEEQKRKQAEERRLAEERKQAEEERKQAEEERKRREAEQQRLAAERKQQQEAKKKAAAEQQRLEQERQRLAAERQRIEQERQRIEQERQHQQQLEQERKDAEQQLASAMAAEERQRQDAARRARALTAAEKYKVLIRQKVSRNWSRPADTGKGLQCLVRVRLAAGGEVLNASIVRSSGNELFDRSVENAVYKASPLPLPEDKDLFEYFREIEFLFNPEA